jgi:hypothetical protein
MLPGPIDRAVDQVLAAAREAVARATEAGEL